MLNKRTRDPKFDYLFKAILTLETIDDCYEFFEDLCTISEIQEMSRRIHAAKLLRDDRVYADIAAQTGLSTATISRVNRSLQYGCDAYRMVFERLAEKEENV